MEKLKEAKFIILVLNFILVFEPLSLRRIRDSIIEWMPKPALIEFDEGLILDEEALTYELSNIMDFLIFENSEVVINQIENAANRLKESLIPQYGIPQRKIRKLIEDYADEEIKRGNRLGLDLSEEDVKEIRQKSKTRLSWIIWESLILELSQRLIKEIETKKLVSEEFLKELKDSIFQRSFAWVEEKTKIFQLHKDYIIQALDKEMLFNDTLLRLLKKENSQRVAVKIIPITEDIQEYLEWNTYLIKLVAKSNSKIISTELILKLQLRKKDQNPKFFSDLEKSLEEISKDAYSNYIVPPGSWIGLEKIDGSIKKVEGDFKGEEVAFILTQESLMHKGVGNLSGYKENLDLETEAVITLLEVWKLGCRGDILESPGLFINPRPKFISVYRDGNNSGVFQVRLVGIEEAKFNKLIKLYRALVSEKFSPEAIKSGFERVFGGGFLKL